jgi:hypothetical protein
MGRYVALPPGLAPRGLTRDAAAAYAGLSPAAFDKARLEQKYPGPTLPGGRYDLVLLQLAMNRYGGGQSARCVEGEPWCAFDLRASTRSESG